MLRTTINPQALKGPHPGAVAADALDFVWTPADVANKNQLRATGREILLAQNTDAGPQTFSFPSVPDPFKRTGDITAYSLGAGDFAMFYFADLLGWMQADGYIYFEASHANVRFALLQLP